MPDHVTPCPNVARLFNFIGHYAEDWSAESGFRRNHADYLTGLFAGCRHVNNIKSSSAKKQNPETRRKEGDQKYWKIQETSPDRLVSQLEQIDLPLPLWLVLLRFSIPPRFKGVLPGLLIFSR
jgi:hypothetical protein